MKPTLAAAAVLLAPTITMTDTSKTETIATPSGPVTTTTQTVEPVPQEILAASAAEIQGFHELAAQAKSFVTAYRGTGVRLSLRSLDEAFRDWQVEATRQFSEQQVVQMLGAYLGSRLTADLDMEWVVVKDQYGTDFAVRSKKVEVLSFPFSSVSKRIELSQYDFMVGVYHAVEHTIKNGDHKAR